MFTHNFIADMYGPFFLAFYAGGDRDHDHRLPQAAECSRRNRAAESASLAQAA